MQAGALRACRNNKTSDLAGMDGREKASTWTDAWLRCGHECLPSRMVSYWRGGGVIYGTAGRRTPRRREWKSISTPPERVVIGHDGGGGRPEERQFVDEHFAAGG